MSRWRIENPSKVEGHVLIDHGNEDWPDNPPRLKRLGPGQSMEIAAGQLGSVVVTALGFKLRITPIPKHKPEKLSKTKARGSS